MNRRAFLSCGLAFPAASVAGGAYATVIEPWRLETVHYAPGPDNWPENFPLRIVALADIHMAPPFMTLSRLEGIVQAANMLKPDIFVLLGDYAEAHRMISHSVSPGETAAVLSGLNAPLGNWAVMGNHDWASDPEARQARASRTRWHDAFEDAGIDVLSNRAARLERNGRGFWIAGLESQCAQTFSARDVGADGLEGTLGQITDDAPAILLAHEPDIFVRVPPRISLTMAGHTHGGQVRLLGRAPVVPSRYGERYAYGHVIENGCHLVVSAGLGCSRLPIRFGIPPELVVVELGESAERFRTSE